MRARLATALVLLSLATAGCAGGASGEETGPTLPPVTAAPSPSAEAVPPEATEPTPEGAAEFVRFFYAEVERAFSERDPGRIAALAAPGCEACDRFVVSVTKLRDRNESAEGLKYEIVSAAAPAVDGDTARVDVVYNGPEAVRYDADGAEISREPAAQFVNEQVDLVRFEGSWRVLEVSRP